MSTQPQHPIAAASHPDPYPYYAGLVSERPFYKDDAFWVASSAGAVTAVFTSDLCRVRPAAEPVPKAIAGGGMAGIFQLMIRMNDGALHAALRPVIADALASADVSRISAQCAGALAAGLKGAPEEVTDFAFQLSVHVIATLLGVPRELTLLARDFARCIAPSVSAEQLERGNAAAMRLREIFGATAATGLLRALLDAAARAGIADTEPVIANAIALLFQIYDGTAGLIGNSLLALAAHREIRRLDLCRKVVSETLRWDAPVHSTRRFVVRDGVLAGHPVRAGEAILVLLAAANRDPAANADPTKFDIERINPRTFSFGAGLHACPGRTLAVEIASAGVAQLLESAADLDELAADFAYAPSPVSRIPLFGGKSRYY